MRNIRWWAVVAGCCALVTTDNGGADKVLRVTPAVGARP